MKINSLALVACSLLGIVLSGCASPAQPELTATVPGIRLEAVSSARVRVLQPTLRMNAGQLVLHGAVMKMRGAITTTFSHLEISCFDGAGHLLHRTPAEFSPASVGQSRLASWQGYYDVVLSCAPPETARIEVRAQEDGAYTTHL